MSLDNYSLFHIEFMDLKNEYEKFSMYALDFVLNLHGIIKVQNTKNKNV